MNNEQIKAFVDQTIEIQNLNEKLKKWEACANRLFVYAMETLHNANTMALYESAKEDVIEYNRLKNENK